MEKNITKNAFFNIIKTLVTYVFPLITFMYASRIFYSEGIGKIQFAQSYTSYFILIAMLGIEKYGIREIAQVRENRVKLSRLSHELLMLNAVSVVAAYGLFFLSIACSGKLRTYQWLLLINSFSIAFTAMGMNWLYSAVEDYKYITVRNCIVNGLSLVLLFLLVHKQEDIYIFVMIQTFAATGSNILNFIHSRHYILYKNMHGYSPMRHLKPVLVIFCMTLFIEVYTHLDVTMLGLISGDAATGLYAAAHKISGMVTAVIGAAIMVTMPRISAYAKNRKINEIKKLSTDSINVILLLSIPSMVGLIMLREQMILIFSGRDFLNAAPTAFILAFRIIFSALNAFFVLYLFIPMGKEKNNLISTGSAALLNFVLNYLLIPQFAQAGAALATVLAEALELTLNLFFLSRIMPVRPLFKNMWQYIIASGAIIAVTLICKTLMSNSYLVTGTAVCLSATLYGGGLLALKNDYLLSAIEKIKKRK